MFLFYFAVNLGIITFHKDLRGPLERRSYVAVIVADSFAILCSYFTPTSSVIKSVSRYGLKDLTWFYGVPDPYELLRDLYKSTLYLSNKTLKGFAFRLPSRFWNAKKSKEHSIPSCFTYWHQLISICTGPIWIAGQICMSFGKYLNM